MKKFFLDHIHLLFYAICLLGLVGSYIFPVFMNLPIVHLFLLACFIIGAVLHHKKARKDDKPMSRTKKIVCVVCFVVGIVLAIIIYLGI